MKPFIAAAVLALPAIVFIAPDAGAGDKPGWKTTQSFQLKGAKVSLSAPVLVARSHGYLWFPTLYQLQGGDILAVMSNYQDDHVRTSTAMHAFSGDGGLSWSQPTEGIYCDSGLRLPDGDQLLLPYYLYPGPDKSLIGPHQIISKGKRAIRRVEEGLTLSGWPRPDKSFAPKLGLAGFVFNGNTIQAKDGAYLATLYGHFKDTSRYALVLAESKDGVKWTIRATIADENCKLEGKEGPCESAMCRVKDGRIMCVYRMNANVPYGQSFSDDDGKTWTLPRSMGKDVFSVQPALATLKDGTIVLTGGRPGIYAWFDLDGNGTSWQRVDLVENHNKHQAKDPITNPAAGGNTSSYTEVIPLDDHSFLCIYDRLPRGWAAIPKDSKETNSVWVVKLTVER